MSDGELKKHYVKLEKIKQEVGELMHFGQVLNERTVDQIIERTELDNKKTKPAMHLLPGAALLSVARILGHGPKPHGKYSWRKYPSDVFVAAIGRHLAKLLDGEIVDPEFGETHYAHIACSALFLDWMHHNKDNVQ